MKPNTFWKVHGGIAPDIITIRLSHKLYKRACISCPLCKFWEPTLDATVLILPLCETYKFNRTVQTLLLTRLCQPSASFCSYIFCIKTDKSCWGYNKYFALFALFCALSWKVLNWVWKVIYDLNVFILKCSDLKNRPERLVFPLNVEVRFVRTRRGLFRAARSSLTKHRAMGSIRWRWAGLCLRWPCHHEWNL